MDAADAVPAADRWDDAPCGLIELDASLHIRRANATFLRLTGLTSAALADALPLSAVLSRPAQIVFESQFVPMLRLNGVVSEVLVDLVATDGARTPMLLNAARVSAADEPGRTVAVLVPVPDRRRYEAMLRQAQQDAERASAESRAAQRRLEFGAQANQALASSRDITTSLTRLAEVLVTELAEWCIVYTIDHGAPSSVVRSAVAHADPALLHRVRQLADRLPRDLTAQSRLKQVLDGGDAVLTPHLSAEGLRAATTSSPVVEVCERLGLRSYMVAPSFARSRRTAVLVVARTAGRLPFTPDDLDVLRDVALHAGMAIENLLLYDREHNASMALQQAMLTAPPAHEGIEIVTRYRPAENHNEVGGDWYDAFSEPDGTLALVIGDVVGHDIAAAAAMGQVRGVIRTLGYTAPGDAAQTLSAADRAAAGLGVRIFATAAFVRMSRTSVGRFTVQWSNAGHPPPIVFRADGTSEVLPFANDPPLGVWPERPRRSRTTTLGVGDILLLYTDGLVERRDEDIPASIAQLCAELTPHAASGIDALLSEALRRDRSDQVDDVALLAVRIREPSGIPTSNLQ